MHGVPTPLLLHRACACDDTGSLYPGKEAGVETSTHKGSGAMLYMGAGDMLAVTSSAY